MTKKAFFLYVDNDKKRSFMVFLELNLINSRFQKYATTRVVEESTTTSLRFYSYWCIIKIRIMLCAENKKKSINKSVVSRGFKRAIAFLRRRENISGDIMLQRSQKFALFGRSWGKKGWVLNGLISEVWLFDSNW